MLRQDDSPEAQARVCQHGLCAKGCGVKGVASSAYIQSLMFATGAGGLAEHILVADALGVNSAQVAIKVSAMQANS